MDFGRKIEIFNALIDIRARVYIIMVILLLPSELHIPTWIPPHIYSCIHYYAWDVWALWATTYTKSRYILTCTYKCIKILSALFWNDQVLRCPPAAQSFIAYRNFSSTCTSILHNVSVCICIFLCVLTLMWKTYCQNDEHTQNWRVAKLFICGSIFDTWRCYVVYAYKFVYMMR